LPNFLENCESWTFYIAAHGLKKGGITPPIDNANCLHFHVQLTIVLLDAYQAKFLVPFNLADESTSSSEFAITTDKAMILQYRVYN